jgi:hypothetical protein
MIDFDMTKNEMGLYTLTPNTPAAIERMGDEPAHFDRSDYAAECAAGLLGEGYTLALDGQELHLADCAA